MMWLTLAFAQDTVLVVDGAVSSAGGDFERVPFDVPAGTVEFEIEHLSSGDSVLDWGLIDPDGTTRGWVGGNRENVIIGTDAASRSYLPGVEPGTWEVVIGKARLTEDPAPYTLSVTLRETATLQRRSDRGPWEAPAPLESTERWYAGDFHVHSVESSAVVVGAVPEPPDDARCGCRTPSQPTVWPLLRRR